jgi:DNA-binding CsgD family transcriptional regulator/PAS domain-containing protein
VVNRVVADNELAEAIYDSLREPIRAREIMTRFARTLDCDAAYFKIIDRANGDILVGAGGGAPEGSERDYLKNYLASDVRVPRVNQAPRRVILDDRRLISAGELRHSEFHHEFLPKYDLAYLLHVNLSRSPRYTTILTCAQSRARGEFGLLQSHTLATYAPHFEESGDLHLRLLDLGGYAVLISAAFDSLPIAGVILDARGRIIFLNAPAKDVLADRDGLAVRGGRLMASDPKAAAALQRALRHAASEITANGKAGADDWPYSLIARPSGRPSYRLELRPLPASCGFRCEDRAAMVLALIHDPCRAAQSLERRLRTTYRLTQAETALALAVASGTVLQDYADQRGVTIGTVRFQMKQVLAKTDCRRQIDLVRLLSRGESMAFD